MECPEGKLYPLSSMIDSIGLSLLKIDFKALFNTTVLIKLSPTK